MILRFCCLYLELQTRSPLIYLRLWPCSGTQLLTIILFEGKVLFIIQWCAQWSSFQEYVLAESEDWMSASLLSLLTGCPWIRNRKQLISVLIMVNNHQRDLYLHFIKGFQKREMFPPFWRSIVESSQHLVTSAHQPWTAAPFDSPAT